MLTWWAVNPKYDDPSPPCRNLRSLVLQNVTAVTYPEEYQVYVSSLSAFALQNSNDQALAVYAAYEREVTVRLGPIDGTLPISLFNSTAMTIAASAPVSVTSECGLCCNAGGGAGAKS